MTVPPTTADLDTWVAGQQGLLQFLGSAVVSPGTQQRAIIVGWTRNDASQGFAHIPDPRTSAEASMMLRGLVAAYGAVTVRVYQFTFAPPAPAALAAPQAIQDQANNPANWTTP